MCVGMQITVKNKNNAIETETAGREQAVLAWKDEYERGDKIIFSLPKKNRFYIIWVGNTMDEASICRAGDMLAYEVPFEESKISYNSKSFTGERRYLTIRRARDYEIKPYRNLTRNVMNQRKSQECYPHAHASVEIRGETMFTACSAIDGVTASLSHGKWPHESWGIDMKDDTQTVLEFSCPVDFDRIVLYTRTNFSHDNWQKGVIFTFSDGTSETMELGKSVKPHIIRLERRDIIWLTFEQLIKADDPSPFPALIQIEVYGREHEVASQSVAESWDAQVLYNNGKNIYSITG